VKNEHRTSTSFNDSDRSNNYLNTLNMTGVIQATRTHEMSDKKISAQNEEYLDSAVVPRPSIISIVNQTSSSNIKKF
jgi:hypothetical protein